jgi:hypothetical protein
MDEKIQIIDTSYISRWAMKDFLNEICMINENLKFETKQFICN